MIAQKKAQSKVDDKSISVQCAMQVIVIECNRDDRYLVMSGSGGMGGMEATDVKIRNS